MGRRSQRKHVGMMDSDDDSSVSSVSTSLSDRMSVLGTEEVQLEKGSLLDDALEALYEKRSSTREKALVVIVEAFNSTLQHEFVEKKFATLLNRCLYSIKRGSAREISLASHVIGLLALTVGPGDNAHEMLEESTPVLSQALKCPSEASKTLLECLAIITFIGGNEPEETEDSMQIMWQLVHPKLGSNVVARKPSPPVVTAMVSAWSFLLTTVDGWRLNPKSWQESMSFFSSLLEKEDRSTRLAAGEALALIFEIGTVEKFSIEFKGSIGGPTQEGNWEEVGYIKGLKGKILSQVRSLCTEAGGKGSAKKDLNHQRNLFRDVLDFIEGGHFPETSMKIGGESLTTSTWSELIQLNFLKHFLGGGFTKHMQENEFLHQVFGFRPKKKSLFAGERRISKSHEKRLYKSPNSLVNKARTQLMNKQRMLSREWNTGHYGVNLGNEDV